MVNDLETNDDPGNGNESEYPAINPVTSCKHTPGSTPK